MSDRNMKLSCDVIQDLLLLYDDDICCEATRKIVEEHLAGCEACRGDRLTALIPSAPEPPVKKEKKAVKNSFKKLHKRWIASVLAVLMLFPLTAVGVLGYNELNGKGKALSNWDEIDAGEEFLEQIRDGNYLEAADLIDFHEEYESILAQLERTKEEEVAEEMSIFQPIVLGGEKMVMNRDLIVGEIEEIEGELPSHVQGDIEIDWYDALSEAKIHGLLPEKFFLETVGASALTETEDGEFVYEFEHPYGDIIYKRINTRWGTYVALEGTEEVLGFLEEDSVTDRTYIESFSIVPESLYNAAVPEEEEYHSEDYDLTQAYYSFLTKDGEEAYCTIRKELYAKQLERMEEWGYTFEDIEFDAVRRIDGEWKTTYYVTYQSEDLLPDTAFPITLYFQGSNGKLSYAGFNQSEFYLEYTSGWLDKILEPESIDFYRMDFGFTFE